MITPSQTFGVLIHKGIIYSVKKQSKNSIKSDKMILTLIVNFLLLNLVLSFVDKTQLTDCQLLSVSECSYDLSDDIIEELTFPNHDPGKKI